jgi:hypothetical protein
MTAPSPTGPRRPRAISPGKRSRTRRPRERRLCRSAVGLPFPRGAPDHEPLCALLAAQDVVDDDPVAWLETAHAGSHGLYLSSRLVASDDVLVALRPCARGRWRAAGRSRRAPRPSSLRAPVRGPAQGGRTLSTLPVLVRVGSHLARRSPPARLRPFSIMGDELVSRQAAILCARGWLLYHGALQTGGDRAG